MKDLNDSEKTIRILKAASTKWMGLSPVYIFYRRNVTFYVFSQVQTLLV